jgi:hypothetical protein
MYKPNELKEPTSGVYKRFPKLSTHKKSLKENPVDFNNTSELLTRYARGEDFLFSYMSAEECKKSRIEYAPSRYNSVNMLLDLERYAIKKMLEALILCYDEADNWITAYKEAVSYNYWSARLGLEFEEFAYGQFLTGERQQAVSGDLRSRGVTLGLCMSLGWTDYARDLRCRLNSAINRGTLFDGGDNFGRRRTQHFLIRLLNAYDKIEDTQGQKSLRCAYDVELLNDLIHSWNTPNVNYLHDLLIRACDRHTHQCRQDSFNKKCFYDFKNWPLEYYNPFEILAVLRLRLLRNLDNPALNHPLLETPLGQLQPISEPIVDDFLGALLIRGRQEETRIIESVFRIS